MAAIPPETAAEIQKLERLHSEHPEGRYFVPLGDRYRKLGMVEQAEALLREGLTRHPDYLSAHIVLGGCLADRGAADGAADEFRYVLSVDPQNLIALRTLGELAAAGGRGAEAERWYRDLLTVDPMNKEARQALDALAGDPSSEVGEPGSETMEWGEIAFTPPPSDSAATDDGYDEFAYGDLSLPGDDPETAPSTGEALAEPEAEFASIARAESFRVEAAFDSDTDADEVVTETIADLYTRQGLHDRAAEVYRELIRRRGGDAALEARLERAERAARGEPEPDPEPTFGELEWEGEGTDAFAASFEAGFPDVGDEPAPWEVEISSVQDPVPTAGGARRTIREALGILLHWTPASPTAEREAEPAAQMPLAALAAEEAEEADLSWLSEILDDESAPDVPARPDEEAADEPPRAAERSTPAAPPPVPDDRAGQDDDEDLESFQAWLQSLKR